MSVNFENLLKQVMGLDAASIGSSAIERAVQDRQSVCQMKDAQAYWEHVHSSATELQELIEAVVVPETWFFRDREAFAALARIVHEEWLRTHAGGILRVLSLPCSTGEEPYSIAMALLDTGFPVQRFRVDAVDISTLALEKARRATYGKNSFRGSELSFRDRYFEATAQAYRLSETVRQQVSFQHGNLFDPGFLPGAEIYDVIFCRNVLIYFDRATQGRAIKVLQRLLTKKGVLFVAPSEAGVLLSHDFVSMKAPLAFAFRKVGAIAGEMKPAATHPAKRAAARSATPRAPTSNSTRIPFAKAAAPAPRPSGTAETGMDAATLLADQGRLVEAAKACEEYLQKHGPSAQAFHLLGLIRDASGNLSEAADYYRKALYLDQNHHETLVHLAFLLEKQGNEAGSQALRIRARRHELTGKK